MLNRSVSGGGARGKTRGGVTAESAPVEFLCDDGAVLNLDCGRDYMNLHMR